jgi:hypothetical protein
MANIVYCWELGDHLGHIGAARPILAELCSRGHKVTAVLRDLKAAGTVFRGLDIQFFQAPGPKQTMLTTPGAPTFARQLVSCGFGQPADSAVMFQSWRGLFRFLSPDFALLDFSPLALLALRGTGTRTAQIGTGFCCPPAVSPFPYVVPCPPELLSTVAEDDQKVLATMNAHLESAGQVPLKRAADLLAGLDETFLKTYPELDHYPNRGPARYWGVWADDKEAAPPAWPAGERRAFVYLHWFETLPVILEVLKHWQIATVVYSTSIPDAIKAKFVSPYLRFETTRQSLPRVAEQCHLAVTHGNHTSTAYLLSRGVPLLMIPLHTEMEITARRIAALGAGHCVYPRQPEQFAPYLGSLLLTETPKQVAMQLAQRWAPFDADRSPVGIADRIEKLLHEERPAVAPAPAVSAGRGRPQKV